MPDLINRNILLSLAFVMSFLSSVFGQDKNREKYLIDSLQFIVNHSTDDSIKVYQLVQISNLYSNDDIEQSILFSEEALNIAEKSKKENLKQYAIFNAGNAFFYQGMFDRASSYFYQYLETQKERGNSKGIAYAYSNIGAIYLKLEDFDAAKISFQNALNILESLEESKDINEQIPNVYNNLGIVFQNKNRIDSSLYFYKKALMSSETLKQKDLFQSAIYNNIGGLFLKSNELDSAFVALNKSMKIRLKINDLSGLANSYNKLGEYYWEVNKTIKAKEQFYAGLKIANEIGSVELKMTFSEKLYLHFMNIQQSDSALKYYIQFNEVKEEINTSEALKELTRLELTSRFKEKEKLAALKQKKIQQTYYFTSAILLMILLIFVLLFVLKNNRVKRLGLEKNNLVLSAENANLEKDNLEKELEIRNKELTTHVMGMIKKNETIAHLVDILSNNLPKENEQLFQSIIRDLNQLQDDNVWEEFEVRYQQVHNNYYRKLQELHPNLTTNERRLCAFLRLNMTTKDIASITGQSLRSIEVARTRLRKKLQITNSDISLVEFLNSL